MTDIFVYGDSLKSCLIAVILMTEKDLKEMAEENNVKDDPR